MKRELVASLLGSMVLAVTASALALMLGSGWILAGLTYLGSGTVGLVLLAVTVPTVAELPPAAEALPVSALLKARIG